MERFVLSKDGTYREISHFQYKQGQNKFDIINFTLILSNNMLAV